jgi:hypothetical protein
MTGIKFMASFGQEMKEVELSQPNGGAGSYHLSVGRYYYGQMIYYSGAGWRFYGNDKAEAELTTTDLDILIGMVIEDQASEGIEP